MISKIINIPSFKKAYVRCNDEKSNEHLKDIFNTEWKRKAFDKEMSKLDEISGNTDVFISTKKIRDVLATGERGYTIFITDKDYHCLTDVGYLTTLDNKSRIKSKFQLINEFLEKALKKE